MSENEAIAALTEIRDLLRNVVVACFNDVDARLDAIETRLDALQGVSGSLAGAQ